MEGLRGLPLRLSGGNMRQLARESTRVKALILCRDNVARFFDQHAEREAGIAGIVRQQWALESLPVTNIEPADDYDAGEENTEPMKTALKGHTLGSVPAECVKQEHISGDPDTDITRNKAKTVANEAALAADLVQHTHVVRGMADSEQQHNPLLAAHVLSSSCVNSGLVIRSVPTKSAHVPDQRFRQILRMRFGVPVAMPLAAWRCNCSDQAGPQHSAWERRVCEANAEEPAHPSFATAPMHGLICRRRWRRVVYRHDQVRDALARALNRISNVRATKEPRVQQQRGANDQRRGDIKVSKGGTTWVLDVGVVCPGTAHYVAAGAHEKPGTAAKAYYTTKMHKYSDQPNFIPFIVETGGRINDEARAWVEQLFDAQEEPADRGHKVKVFRDVSRVLVKIQGYMMAQIVEEIRAPDRAVEQGDGAV